jgi:aryl-phospho-beta-D-glucosidase BglC (GH1 family)
MFHGVARPSLEWSPTGQQLSAADFQLMATWKANVVRIALNQDFWIAESPIANADYPATVDAAVKWAEEAGMDVILDLHWSDAGTLGSCKSSCQQLMADTNSIGFWADVASRYKNDGRVLFELYNEPHDVPWNVWKSGGKTSGGWTAAGMQQLYDAVRGAGAENLVIIGGLNYAFDLSGVPSNRISGYNILYASHPYGGSSDKGPSAWEAGWGFLTKTDPVILTEFGDGADCSGGTYSPAINTYVSTLITFADSHAANWTAWAWFSGGCSFPSLISDWEGTPTPPGMIVKTALIGYTDPAPSGKRDAGTSDASGAGGAGGAAGAADGGAGGQGAPGDASIGG